MNIPRNVVGLLSAPEPVIGSQDANGKADMILAAHQWSAHAL
ncbi:hypothetical protein [Paraburkholderia sp. SG-MS1]|nr:hypothetical protein [Paraburkholderia sp. SG-MS1]